ncbi:hypothetical protein D9M69_258960 [compost metagenome]
MGVSTGAISRRPAAEKQARVISRNSVPRGQAPEEKAFTAAAMVTRITISTMIDTAWWTKSKLGITLPRAATSNWRRCWLSNSRTGRIWRMPQGDRQVTRKMA